MSRDRDESGFTLVELLVATVVSGIIIGGIASILIVTLQSYPRSAAKLSASENAQLLSTWLVPDVQSADGGGCGIQAPPGNNAGCPPPACAAPDDKLRLTWSDAIVVNTTWSADYCLVGSELIRYYQQSGKPVTETVVGRNIAAGGLVVLTGASPPTGDGPVVLSVDTVDVQVTTTDLVNGAPYRFDVSASRRTPALRIYPVPDINMASAATGFVNGTAPPGAQVSLSITDSLGKTVGLPPISADKFGNWIAQNIDWTGLQDGLVTFKAQSTSNGYLSTATTTAYKDTTPPKATVTLVKPAQNAPTHTPPLVFRVQFTEHVTAPPLTIATIPPGNPSEQTTVDQQAPCPAGSDVASECFTVTIDKLNTTNDSGDGPVSVTVPVGAVKDDSGNPNTAASNTVTVQWDLNPPIVVVTPQPPSPTSNDGLVFVATVSKPVGNLSVANVAVSAPAADLPLPPVGIASFAPCPASNTCFQITVTGLASTDIAGGPVRVTVKANSFTDAEGLSNPNDVVSDPIVWAPLTIHETGPRTSAVFNGVAAPGTVTVALCTDAACAVTPTPLQNVPVKADGTWQTDPAMLNAATYAEALQTGVTKPAIIPLPSS